VYAYVEGREVEALAYFERLLTTIEDRAEREELLALIARLKRIIQEKGDAEVQETSSITFHSAPGSAVNRLASR
jgi:hypothetical protein